MIEKVCVYGAGIMGTDIAQVFATSGLKVVMKDMTEDICLKAVDRMKANLAKLVSKGRMTEEKANEIIKNVSTTTKDRDLADCDLVLEAIVEKIAVKETVFKNLDDVCKPETIFATNTSSISITEIASATDRPEKFIGMHFFNPATVMKLIEVIRGLDTSDETYQEIFDLSKRLGKKPVEVSEGPGFVVNRILIPMINDAIQMYAEGVSSKEEIDMALKLGLGHKMGPLALGDVIGLDTCLNIMNVMYQETGDTRYRPALLLKKMVRSGKLGKKTGRGFYTYGQGGTKKS